VPKYRVTLTASAERELGDLSTNLIARIMPRLENLAFDPRPRGCKKLWGGYSEWRIRIGDYRVVYTIEESNKSVEITRIAHRRDVYER
jgi:mRNA interferase RelE/StbE